MASNALHVVTSSFSVETEQFRAEKARWRAMVVRYAIKGRIEFHSSTVIKCNMQTCCATLIFSNCPLLSWPAMADFPPRSLSQIVLSRFGGLINMHCHLIRPHCWYVRGAKKQKGKGEKCGRNFVIGSSKRNRGRGLCMGNLQFVK